MISQTFDDILKNLKQQKNGSNNTNISSGSGASTNSNANGGGINFKLTNYEEQMIQNNPNLIENLKFTEPIFKNNFFSSI
jgi:hypothetical protein